MIDEEIKELGDILYPILDNLYDGVEGTVCEDIARKLFEVGYRRAAKPVVNWEAVKVEVLKSPQDIIDKILDLNWKGNKAVVARGLPYFDAHTFFGDRFIFQDEERYYKDFHFGTEERVIQGIKLFSQLWVEGSRNLVIASADKRDLIALFWLLDSRFSETLEKFFEDDKQFISLIEEYMKVNYGA